MNAIESERLGCHRIPRRGGTFDHGMRRHKRSHAIRRYYDDAVDRQFIGIIQLWYYDNIWLWFVGINDSHWHNPSS
jgi:hypothetical protein